MKKGNFLKNSKGQTLIEALVTLAVAVIIITSLIVLVIASNRRVTLSRQANQATKLAQESLELVRNIRDNNFPISVGLTNSCSDPATNWADLYDCDHDGSGQSPVKACLEFVTDHWELVAVPADGCSPDVEELRLGIFERTIQIEDNNVYDSSDPPDGIDDAVCSGIGHGFDRTKRVTARISWQSPIGEQERVATTCLTRLF